MFARGTARTIENKKNLLNMEDKMLAKLMGELRTLGHDVKVSSGREIPSGGKNVCASSSTTDFRQNRKLIEDTASYYRMQPRVLQEHFLELEYKESGK